jgi:ribose 5-phosphate isomerase B
MRQVPQSSVLEWPYTLSLHFMKIAIASDHAGFGLKQHLLDYLTRGGHAVTDLGTNSPDSCDYPDYAEAGSRRVVSGEAERAILVCSTGVGMAIAANKIAGIRAALGSELEEVELTRSHNDANVLTLGAKFTAAEKAEALVELFLTTPFAGGRHARRVAKITALEGAAASPDAAPGAPELIGQTEG